MSEQLDKSLKKLGRNLVKIADQYNHAVGKLVADELHLNQTKEATHE